MSETTYQLPYSDHVERLSVETNCSTCAKAKEVKIAITPQEAIIITPFAENVDPMDALKLSKRLVICTVCGTLRLIN